MGIVRTRHTGLVVESIDRALSLYRDILGFKVWRRALEPQGSYVDSLVGMPGVKVEYAKLEVGDGTLVELLQYHSHPQAGLGKPYPSNRHGASHIAFTVSDIQLLYAKLTSAGIHCNSAPLVSPDGKVKVLYCHDFDGIILEFVEEIRVSPAVPSAADAR